MTNMNTSCTTGATNIVQLPLAFVRSGYVNLNNGYVDNVGSNGYNWSRTASSSTGARNLNFSTTGVSPSAYSSRYLGFSLRWLGLPVRCRSLKRGCRKIIKLYD